MDDSCQRNHDEPTLTPPLHCSQAAAPCPCSSRTTLRQTGSKMSAIRIVSKNQCDLHNKRPKSHPSHLLFIRIGSEFRPNVDVRVHERCSILHHLRLFLPPWFSTCCGTNSSSKRTIPIISKLLDKCNHDIVQ